MGAEARGSPARRRHPGEAVGHGSRRRPHARRWPRSYELGSHRRDARSRARRMAFALVKWGLHIRRPGGRAVARVASALTSVKGCGPWAA